MIPYRMAGNENVNEQKYDYENVIGGLPGLVRALGGKTTGSIVELRPESTKPFLSTAPTIVRNEESVPVKSALIVGIGM